MTNDGSTLADVVALPWVGGARGWPVDASAMASVVAAVTDAARTLDRDVRYLLRTYHDHWRDVPATLGRAALAAESQLTTAPLTLDAERAEPAPTALVLEPIVTNALRTADVAMRDGALLGEVFGVRLDDIPVSRLAAISDAVLQLGAAPSADPRWGDPDAAAAASVVLEAFGAQLAESRRLHAELYRTYTDRLWLADRGMLANPPRRHRVVRRARLRRHLRAARRPGVRARVGATVATVANAARLRSSIERSRDLLAEHLGIHERGAMTDATEAQAALSAVRDLQHSLGDRLDRTRLAELLAADAFAAQEVLVPAAAIALAATGLADDVAAVDAVDAASLLALAPRDLHRWAIATRHAIDVIDDAVERTTPLRRRARTLRELVTDLAARQRAEELRVLLDGALRDDEGDRRNR